MLLAGKTTHCKNFAVSCPVDLFSQVKLGIEKAQGHVSSVCSISLLPLPQPNQDIMFCFYRQVFTEKIFFIKVDLHLKSSCRSGFLMGDSLFVLKISKEQVSPHQRCVVTDLNEKQSIPLNNMEDAWQLRGRSL